MGSGLQTCKVMPFPNEDLIIGSKRHLVIRLLPLTPPVTVGPATATHAALPTDNPNLFR